MIFANVVIRSFKFFKRIRSNHESVFIVEVSANRTVVDHHLTVCAKSISTCGNDTVGFSGRNSRSGINSNATKAIKAGASTAKIVRTVNIMNTARGHTVFYDIIITIQLIKSVCNGYALIGSTVFSEDIPVCGSIGVILNETNAGIHIGISAEIIGLSIHFYPHTCVVSGSIAIFRTLVVGYPSTVGYTVCIKSIFNAVYGSLADSKLIIASGKAILSIACILPAGLEIVVDGVIEITIHLEDTGAGLIQQSTSATASKAYKLSIINLKFVFDSGNDSTPINYGSTSLTIGSV